MTPDEFKLMRKAAGMTQAQMAARLGVSRRTVISWEAGEFNMPNDLADKIATEGLQAAPIVKHKPINEKTHPQCYRLHHAGRYRRTHLHPHWYLQSTALQAKWTPEQCAQADAFITTTEHFENYVPPAPDEAVALLVRLGLEPVEARYVARVHGFDVPPDNPLLSDADLLS